LEDLSDASFLVKLLGLPVNVRLDWKVIARYKHSSLYGLVVRNEGKKFNNIDTRRKSRVGFDGPRPKLRSVAEALKGPKRVYKKQRSLMTRHLPLQEAMKNGNS
jgi:hypothetical protein